MSFNFSNGVKILDAEKISIYRDSSGILKAKIEGEEKEYLIKPSRCFPLTGLERYLVLFKINAEQKAEEELALISDLQRLDENSHQLIEEELDKIYTFVWISKIYSVKQVGKAWRWEAETPKGRRTFEVQNQSDIYTIQPNIVVIKDSAGNRYCITMHQLDPKSQALLEIYS